MKSIHTSTNWLADLKALNPCSDGYAFASKFRTWQKCWDNIERGDWSLRVLGKLSGAPESDNRKKLVLAACECARTALKFTKDPRVLKCIETAEAWCRGEATIEQVREARIDAAAAAYAAASAAADAYADAYAAAYAAAAADAAADAYAAKKKALKTCAAIVRKHFPKAPNLKP